MKVGFEGVYVFIGMFALMLSLIDERMLAFENKRR